MAQENNMDIAFDQILKSDVRIIVETAILKILLICNDDSGLP
jgi:hypothetical protein